MAGGRLGSSRYVACKLIVAHRQHLHRAVDMIGWQTFILLFLAEIGLLPVWPPELWLDSERITKPVERFCGDKRQNINLTRFVTVDPAFVKSHLQLYVRLKSASSWGETRSYLLQSLQIFWPQSHLVLVLDGDDPVEKNFSGRVERLCAEYKPVSVEGAVSPRRVDGRLVSRAGRKWSWDDRRKMDVFFADHTIKAKYVAFVDTDTVFSTVVTPESIFAKNSKPRVIARLSHDPIPRGQQVTCASAELALRRPCVMICDVMAPMVVRTEHLATLRQHIDRLHQTSFEQFYAEVWANQSNLCHATILCNYLWYNHREQYDFHFERTRERREAHLKKRAAKQAQKFIGLSKEVQAPIARVAIRGSQADPTFFDGTDFVFNGQGDFHLWNRYGQFIIAPLLARGYCFAAMAFCTTSEKCRQIEALCKRVTFKKERFLPLFMFQQESLSSGWIADSREAIEAEMSYKSTLKGREEWLMYAATVLRRRQPLMWRRLNPACRMERLVSRTS